MVYFRISFIIWSQKWYILSPESIDTELCECFAQALIPCNVLQCSHHHYALLNMNTYIACDICTLPELVHGLRTFILACRRIFWNYRNKQYIIISWSQNMETKDLLIPVRWPGCVKSYWPSFPAQVSCHLDLSWIHHCLLGDPLHLAHQTHPHNSSIYLQTHEKDGFPHWTLSVHFSVDIWPRVLGFN